MAGTGPRYLLGVDTGGTFTDFACLMPDGTWRRWKVLSTPDDPSRAIVQGLHQLLGPFSPDEIEMVHGTTVGTNAFLERKGAQTCLVTTKGFEDVIFIGRQARPSLYDLNVEKPPGIVPEGRILGVKERMLHDGRVLVPLKRAELDRAVSFCQEKGAESVAVCLLHSYANPDHERALKEALEEAGFQVSASCEVIPEFREFERFSTTLINAYLGPVVGGYVDRLQTELSGARIFVQQSNGGALPAEAVSSRAVTTLLSGPAGGVAAAWQLAEAFGIDKIITLDMGGTSTDVSLCSGGLTYTRDYKIEGFPVALPIIDIHTVGAGGGSLAWIDKGGLLKVGPQSAGADPGPICYGKGEAVTVTDANLYLGRLVADGFLGGRMELFPERVGPALDELAGQLQLDPVETAAGIIRLVNLNMVQAIGAVSLERGHDPMDFVLVSFGGAAGLHALELAEELEIGRVIMPAMAGVFSAQGMAGARLAFDSSAAISFRSDRDGESLIRRALDRLYREQFAYLADFSITPDRCRTEARLDVRYHGQSFEITVPFDGKGTRWQKEFEESHKRLYGHIYSDRALEVTAVRLRIEVEPCHEIPSGHGMDEKRAFVDEANAGKASEGLLDTDGFAKTALYLSGRLRQVPVIPRERLAQGAFFTGPALILDEFTTILVPDGWQVHNLNGHLSCVRSARRSA
jgi:N-methylhydantoinase A